MQIKWLLSLVFLTSLFIITGFFIPEDLVFGYSWMTIGVSLVSFIYYYIVISANKKDSKKMIGGNLAAIVIKFILSSIVVIIYIVFFNSESQLEFAFFFIAYSLFSVINYLFSYKL